MDKPIRNLQAELETLLKQGQNGTLDFNTCVTKMARKALEQNDCDVALYGLIEQALANEATVGFGIVAHILTLRILRLEDDVRVLRSELARERIGKTRKDGGEHEQV